MVSIKRTGIGITTIMKFTPRGTVMTAAEHIRQVVGGECLMEVRIVQGVLTSGSILNATRCRSFLECYSMPNTVRSLVERDQPGHENSFA